MTALHQLEHARRDDPDARLALLLQRRRAGLLTDENLHLAAYLGDAAARTLWAPNVPSELAIEDRLRSEFFRGLKEETDAAWAAALDAPQALSSERPQEAERLVRSMMHEPRLRRLFPVLDREHLSLRRATTSPLYELSVYPSIDGGFYVHSQERNGVSAARRSCATAREAALAASELLPPRPKPVWRGGLDAYPRARIRLGATNDDFDPEPWVFGLLAWGQPVFLRGLLPVLVEAWLAKGWKLDRDQAFAMAARWLNGQATEPRRESEAWFYEMIEALPDDASDANFVDLVGGLIGAFGEEGVRERLRENLVPWALGDHDPLRPYRQER